MAGFPLRVATLPPLRATPVPVPEASAVRQAALREREGHRPLPQENRLLKAMQSGLPSCAGVALGVDRLVMLALGAESLAEVMAFPFERA